MARTALVAATLIVGAELAARWVCRPENSIWAYWHPDAGANFERFREVTDQGLCPEVIVVGDSTAQSNIEPAVLESLTSPDALTWNLGCAGNFPNAFRRTTLPVLRRLEHPPTIVLASFIPSGFFESSSVNEMESRILTSAHCRRERWETQWTDELHLSRIWSYLQVWKAVRKGSLARIIDSRGFLIRDNQSQAMANHKASRPPRDLAIDAERLQVLDELSAWARDRHVRLIVIIPPTFEPSAQRREMNRLYALALNRKSREQGFELFDPQAIGPYDIGEFADENHLNARGASRMTGDLSELKPILFTHRRRAP